MELQKIQIQNFMCIADKELNLEKKLFIIQGKNGLGKTTILRALNFLLSGNVPKNPIKPGTEKATVTGTLADGTIIIRTIEATKNDFTVTNYINSKKVTSAEITNLLLNGAAEKNMKMALNLVSSDKLNEMKPDELADFLISFLPDKPSLEKIIGYMTDSSEPVVEYLEKTIAEEEIDQNNLSLKEINALYKVFYNQRTVIKKLVKQEPIKPEIVSNLTEEVIQQRLTEISQLKANKIAFINNKKQLSEVEASLEKLKNVVSRKEEMDFLLKELEQTDADLRTKTKEKAVFDKTMQTTLDAATALKQGRCPYSIEKMEIKCTADTTPIRYELGLLYKQAKECSALKELEIKNLTENKVKQTEYYQKLVKNEQFYVKKVELSKQLNSLKETISQIKLPSEDVDFSKEETDLKNALKSIGAMNEYKANLEQYEKNKKIKDILEKLVAQFSPKGPICGNITQYYIETFNKAANDIVVNGLKVTFAVDNGIQIYASYSDNNDMKVPYSSLSGGEQLIAKIVVLNVINQLSGAKIMALDELDVLDTTNFKTVFKVLNELTKSYDKIFVTLTDTHKFKTLNENTELITV